MYLTHIDAMTAHHKNLMHQAENRCTISLLRHDEGFTLAKRKRQTPIRIVPYFA
ncbi:MAG: hypothetical protein ACPG7F_07625 [Aggregatilineales bacterium]